MSQAKVILAINAGSSSVKVTVYKATSSSSSSASLANGDPEALATVQIAGLTAPPAILSYARGDEKTKDQQVKDVGSQQDAFKRILDRLLSDQGLTEVSKKEDIDVACHRVVHGGDYDKPHTIDRDTYARLEALSDLAPLHNAGALEIVKAVHKELPSVKNIAFFDSAFHATIPPPACTYAIDQTVAKKNKLRKYGFHGLSYAFITRAVAQHLHQAPSATNIIALHLGSGASACCIQRGQSVDTSMGLTPLAGLPGATRSGDVDPSLVFHFTNDAGKLSPLSTKDLHLTTAEEILNKKSGWQAICGTTDFGTISAKAHQQPKGNQDCRLAFDLFVDRILGFVGSYYVKLGGHVDALVFAGGIGEKGAELRSAISSRLACLGFALDASANAAKLGEEVVVDVSREPTKHKILVCRTDEQMEMARQCAE